MGSPREHHHGGVNSMEPTASDNVEKCEELFVGKGYQAIFAQVHRA
jgi:hypothetical protein